MELSDDPRSRGPVEASPVHLPCVSQVRSSSYSTVQQQGYSASIFLRRKDKLEQVRYLSNIKRWFISAFWKVKRWSLRERRNNKQRLGDVSKVCYQSYCPVCVLAPCEPRQSRVLSTENTFILHACSASALALENCCWISVHLSSAPSNENWLPLSSLLPHTKYKHRRDAHKGSTI